jgi:hypothetical protein
LLYPIQIFLVYFSRLKDLFSKKLSGFPLLSIPSLQGGHPAHPQQYQLLPHLARVSQKRGKIPEAEAVRAQIRRLSGARGRGAKPIDLF